MAKDSKIINRRDFLKKGSLAGLTGAGLLALAASPLLRIDHGDRFKELFQKHYQKLSPEEKEKILKNLEQKAKDQYGTEVTISDDPPIKDVVFAYALNLDVCIGCRQCVHACAQENNQTRSGTMEWIRVVEMDKGGFNFEHSDHYYSHPVPQEGKFYMPIQCQQCDNPPCTKVCPVKATWKESDGIIVVDYNWCIGCRYCQAACPYFARRFNFSKPTLKASDINTNQAYLGNRIRTSGAMEKCTFCIQRTRKGLMPACHDACPTGARKFGDFNDHNSPVRYVFENKNVYLFKEELGTVPRFFYYFN